MVMTVVPPDGSEPIVSVDLEPDQWVELKRQHQSVRRAVQGQWLFRCVEGHHPLIPKTNSLGTQFFAHAPDPPAECVLKTLDGESPEHRLLKVAIYRAARRVSGWTGALEVATPEPDPLTNRPVIVDVAQPGTMPAMSRQVGSSDGKSSSRASTKAWYSVVRGFATAGWRAVRG